MWAGWQRDPFCSHNAPVSEPAWTRTSLSAKYVCSACRGNKGVVKSLDQGLPCFWSGSAGKLGPGSGPLGGVQRTPGDQEKSHSTLSCHSLLQQVQEGGSAQMVSFQIATSHLSEPLLQLAGVLAHLKLSGCQDSSTF